MTTIDITIKNGEPAGMTKRFSPEETISGTLLVVPEKDLKCRHLYVRARWHTEGRGDRDSGVGAEVDLFQGTLKAGMPAEYPFELSLPREPWSYAGHYINIVWELEAVIDLRLTKDPRATIEFVMAPRQPAENF